MRHYNGFTPAQRYKALRWLNCEYAAGLRTRPVVCDACGQTHGKIEAHSEDYSEPFGPHIGRYGLCYRCHMMIHCRFRNPEAFIAYREDVRAGKRYTPITWRAFDKVIDQINGKPVKFTVHPPRSTTFLDTLSLKEITLKP